MSSFRKVECRRSKMRSDVCLFLSFFHSRCLSLSFFFVAAICFRPAPPSREMRIWTPSERRRISGLCCRKKGGKAADRSGGRGSRPCLTFALARARQIDQRAPQQVRGRRTDNSSTAATFAPFSLLCRVPTPPPTFPSLLMDC